MRKVLLEKDSPTNKKRKSLIEGALHGFDQTRILRSSFLTSRSIAFKIFTLLEKLQMSHHKVNAQRYVSRFKSETEGCGLQSKICHICPAQLSSYFERNPGNPHVNSNTLNVLSLNQLTNVLLWLPLTTVGDG